MLWSWEAESQLLACRMLLWEQSGRSWEELGLPCVKREAMSFQPLEEPVNPPTQTSSLPLPATTPAQEGNRSQHAVRSGCSAELEHGMLGSVLSMGNGGHNVLHLVPMMEEPRAISPRCNETLKPGKWAVQLWHPSL